MATKEGVGRAFVLLRRAYPDHVQRYLPTKDDMAEQMDFYQRLLTDVPDEVLLAATQSHIAASQWWPKVSELREKAFDILCGESGMPSAFEAYAMVRRRLAYSPDGYFRNGKHISVDELPEFRANPIPDVVHKAVEGCGGWAMFRASENEVADRARFYQAYETAVRRLRQRAEMLPAVADAINRIAQRQEAAQIEAE